MILWESLPEVPKDLASLRETEQASSRSFFNGDRGGVHVHGGEWDAGAAKSSSPEEPLLSKREGELSGALNEISAALLDLFSSFS